MSSQYKCCICGRMCSGFGNNPAPIVNTKNSRCCDDCNFGVVVPRRLNDWKEDKKKMEKKK